MMNSQNDCASCKYYDKAFDECNRTGRKCPEEGKIGKCLFYEPKEVERIKIINVPR